MGKIGNYIVSFSKLITIAWVAVWIETIVFTQIATLFNLGDAAAIQYINDNVVQIGLIICGFYFSTKCLENLANGIEEHRLAMLNECEVSEELLDGPQVEYGGEGND